LHHLVRVSTPLKVINFIHFLHPSHQPESRTTPETTSKTTLAYHNPDFRSQSHCCHLCPGTSPTTT
jgi:hypothetical protein